VSHFLFTETANILDSAQFSDTFTNRFFMRVHFAQTTQALNLERLKSSFAAVGQQFQMDWELFDAASKPKVLIMVSKLGHCLNDLLFRTHSGYLPIEIAGIVSNHQDFEGLAKTYNIPFHHMPLSSATDAR
ncbi:MAG: formyltetrahydrofolate deformylase, partial [Polynucleobacter victoriensis]